MISWGFNGKYYSFGLYLRKDNVHIGNIAKKYNGGGHKSASGFKLHKEQFKKRVQIIV